MKSPATKRTVYVDGRKTGVSLEDAFWSCLNEITQAQGVTVSQTVTEIEKSRQGGKPVLRDPPVRTRPGPFTKSGGHRSEDGSPISAASLGGREADGLNPSNSGPRFAFPT